MESNEPFFNPKDSVEKNARRFIDDFFLIQSSIPLIFL
ncbi:hypothetical protein FTV88_1965 [Heliorestis convoluta]|uniref:Uncharacterized protein n=1 Tax=Heliorestis convoluta TaxID=356322 RepID=A0A5Q2N2G2_9FIRM|nr:hypothetical protein FTV88_1965 [Heliorestis convoluta]